MILDHRAVEVKQGEHRFYRRKHTDYVLQLFDEKCRQCRDLFVSQHQVRNLYQGIRQEVNALLPCLVIGSGTVLTCSHDVRG